VEELARRIAAHGLGPPAPVAEEPLPAALWQALLPTVKKERLTGLLLAAIDDGALPVEDEQTSDARRLALREAQKVLRLEAALVQLADRLDDLGVPHRVLKGPVLAHVVYARPDLRPFRDIDVLVPGADIGRVVASLEGEGGTRRFRPCRPGFDQRFAKGINVRSPEGIDVDLHRTLALGPYGLALDPAELFTSSTPFAVGERRLLGLGTDELLLHAGYHAALGDWPPRLIPHRDVAELILRAGGHAHADADRTVALAARWKGRAPLSRAIRRAATWFELDRDLPMVRWALGFTPSTWDVRAQSLYRSGNSSALAAAAIVSVTGMRNRWDYARMLLVPDRAYLADHEGGYRSRWRHAARLVAGLATVRRRAGAPGPEDVDAPEVTAAPTGP
jgi:hypothetical protein